jgi:hypothetical protein
MGAPPPASALEAARTHLGLSMEQLWTGYMALGGSLLPYHLEAYLDGTGQLADYDHDLVAHSLNERFSERGQDHPLAYSDRQPLGG